MSGVATELERVVGADGVGARTIDGAPVPEARPASEEEARELVRLAGANGWTLLPLGAGTKLGWCHPAERVDFALATTRLRGVLRYEPGDGTVSAAAGTPVAELREAARAGGHHLSPEVPSAAGATIGGVVAAGQSGVDRLRYGPVRNTLLGTRSIQADATFLESGGQLVKNVTGYDVHRVHCGGHGAAGLLVAVYLRLFPLPESQVAMEFERDDLASAWGAATEALAAAPEAVAVSVRGSAGGRWRVEAFLAGRGASVDAECERVASALGSGSFAQGDDAEEARATLREARARDGWPHVRLQCVPSRLEAALERAAARAAELGLAVDVVAHPGIATADLRFRELDDERARALARSFGELGVDVLWTGAPDPLRAELDLFGPATAGTPLARKLKAALDPAGVFPRGRTHGRI